MSKIDLVSALWTMHEFFAGSGLVAYGLKDFFRPVWSNDICPKKASVYKTNFLGNHFVEEDIRNISGVKLPYAHLSWASFPCQDLSLAGSLGGINAKRSGLVWEWFRILKEMHTMPAILVIENVTGLLSAQNGENYVQLHQHLTELGYRSGAILVDACNFVPQSRPRIFVISVKKNISIPSELIDSGPNWLHNTAAISLGSKLSHWVWWKTPKPPKLSLKLSDIVDHNVPYDKNSVLKLIPKHHKTKLDNLDNVIVTGYRRTRQGEQCLELRFDGIAGCLRTPEGGSSKQFVVVKENGTLNARLLTVREAARLMGAPNSYILPETYNDAYKAMGDAVALPVARFIGDAFLLKLAEAAYNEPLKLAS